MKTQLKYKIACAATLAALFILTVWVVMPLVLNAGWTPRVSAAACVFWAALVGYIAMRASCWTIYDSWKLK